MFIRYLTTKDKAELLIPMHKLSSDDNSRYISSLSLLEVNAHLLYQAILIKTANQDVNSFLDEISQDSLKHSTLLKALSTVSIPIAPQAPLFSEISATNNEAETIRNRIQATEKITDLMLPEIFRKLLTLETSLYEYYGFFLQIDLHKSLENIFLDFLNDEEKHKELLKRAEVTVSQKTQEQPDHTPQVKYKNPDSWSGAMPPTY